MTAEATQPPDPVGAAHAERVALNFSWLLKLRWVAVVGQLATILTTSLVLAVELPLVVLLSIVAVGALTNAAFVLWFHYTSRTEGWDSVAAHGEALIGLIMLLDIVLLTGLLYVGGGPANPFSIFYLVNVVLAAVLLRPLWGWVLVAVAAWCYGTLFLDHMPLAVFERENNVRGVSLHAVGTFVAFFTATITMLYFFTRLTNELDRIEAELVVARQRRVQSDRLEAMATLAAGAAHELASPLSTIAVVAKELERELARPVDLQHAADDARLIRSEVARCREILDQMSADAGESAGEPLVRVSVRALLESVLDNVGAEDRVSLAIEEPVAGVSLLLPERAVAQAVRGLVKNALDASRAGQNVDLGARVRNRTVEFEVRDQGHGMDAATLEKVGNPFFTTKEPGRGMGLGVFLARTVVERLGGSMELTSVPGQGTSARIRLPLEAEPLETRGFGSTSSVS